MEDLARSEYPAMLANLQPMQAVHTLTDRVKRINKLNVEIADWLQERRKVEEQYVQGLRKLTQFKVPNAQSELGVFESPWHKILQSVDTIAHTHHLFASRVERDIETPLRNFHTKKEVLNIQTIGTNLTTMAKDLEDAQERSDKLNKKGGKANAQKVDAASTKLESANQQWESQAPFIFETLQVLDEQRVNQLRDLLTQFQTHESDRAQREQLTAEETLSSMLEVDTAQEIQSYAQKVTSGKPKLEKRTSTRQSTNLAASATLAPPGTGAAHDDETTSETSVHNENPPQSRLRSRIGTMLGRRRQSIHGGFGQISPQRSSGPFGRVGSSHGRVISPRASVNDLSSSTNKLAALTEAPDSPKVAESSAEKEKTAHEGTNGIVSSPDAAADTAPVASSGAVNGTDGSDVPPPSGPRPSQAKDSEVSKDAEGFTIPPPTTDPISQAQKEAAEEGDQLFKLNIQSAPVAEEDPDAKQAAMSNVANTLTQMALPSRKVGTVRGRRDVRNSIYVPPSNPTEGSSGPFPPSPSLSGANSKPAAVAALASEASVAGTSDTQSVRSANSLGVIPQAKHPDMSGPGLNSSIIETINACFEDGVAKSAKINGEIAFSYNAGESGLSSSQETIRIGNFPNLEVIGPNRIFVQNVSTSHTDQFVLDLSHIPKMSPAFSYRIHSDDPEGASLAANAPLLIRPAWKPQGDKLGLLLQYCRNPDCQLPDPVTLHNVVIFATYEGARASGAQTKPSGTHLKEKHLVYWRLGDVTLSSETHRIVCRIVGAENAEPKPGHIEARWEYSPEGPTTTSLTGMFVSRLEEGKGKGKEEASDDDPFADDNPTSPGLQPDQEWVDVPLSYKLQSGKYESKESSSG